MNKLFIIIAIVILLLFINNLKKYIEIKENFNDVNTTNNSEYILPKVLYTFWDNLESDTLIQAHMNNWHKKFSKEWKIVIISTKTLHQYVSDDFIKKYAQCQIDTTRFSDFLRIELLTKNGGVWLDASVIIITGQFLDDYYNEMIQNKYDGLFYEYKEFTQLETQPHIENWFIMAPKNSKILIDLYREFDKAFGMGFVTYKKEVLIKSGTLIKLTLGYDDDNTYLMQHAILQYLLKDDYNKYNIKLKNATENMYKIHQNFNWNHVDIIKFILTNTNWENHIGIKLTRHNREVIPNRDEFIQKINQF
jgi:hypothetical protein